MLRTQEDMLEKIIKLDLQEDIGDTECENARTLEAYHQLQTYFQEYTLHFNSIMRVSEQFGAVMQDFAKESARIGQVAAFIRKGADRQTVEIEKSMSLVKAFSDKVNSIYDQSRDIIAMACEMENSNRDVQGSVDQLVTNQAKNDSAIGNMFDVIGRLISKTTKIGGITQIMKRVSTETLLLGLNAKVEAARAGEQGRGFSVVAGEIQRLSEESKTAADDINETIKSFSDEISVLQQVARESQELFRVQQDTVTEVDSVFKTNSETINTFISEQKGFTASIAEIRNDETMLTDNIGNIVSSVREIAATVNEIGSTLVDHNNSIMLMSKLEEDLTHDVSALQKTGQAVRVTKTAAVKKRVAFLFDIDHPFYSPTKAEAKKAAGIYNFDVSFFAPRSRDEATKEQAAQLDKVIEEKYDGVVISPINDDLISAKLARLNRMGTKIIFLNARLGNIENVSLVMTDGIGIGAAAARIVMGALGNEGEAIVNAWTGMKLDAIENRKDGFVQELRKNSRIKVHEYPVKSNPSAGEAEAIIRSMLQSYPNTRFLYMTNLEWGMFAAGYMGKYHPDVQVITVDFSDEVIGAIREGRLHYSLGQRPYLWGSTAIRILDRSFLNKKVEKTIDTGTFEVNKQNVEIYAGLS